MSSSSSSSLITAVGRGESPGRLDFMGGVADYSGSLVLEMPISGKMRVEATYTPAPQIILSSVEFGEYRFNLKILRSLLVTYLTARNAPNAASLSADKLRERELAFLDTVRQHLIETNVAGWARYVIGCLSVFCIRKNWLPGVGLFKFVASGQRKLDEDGGASYPLGLSFRVSSEVNSSMGVSSSAALEISTLRSVSSLAHHTELARAGTVDPSLAFVGTELAHFGQLAENRVVGAPCGLMDQLSVAFGAPKHVLPILCRPDVLFDNIELPHDVVVIGWPSGIKHSVGESPYSTARTASFMGRKIMEAVSGQKVRFTAEFTVSSIHAPVPASAAAASAYSAAHHHHGPASTQTCLSHLPESMRGSDFISKYGEVDDALSEVHPDRNYPVRAAFSYPIHENFRCQLVASLLASLSSLPKTSPASSALSREAVLSQIGELMYQSHRGYSAMGLGCPETDEIIRILQGLRSRGVYGARISGGGSGGTVAILTHVGAIEAVRAECKKFLSSAKLDIIV